MNKQIEAFLIDKTGILSHSGRTLFDHLRGTYDLLRADKAPDRVCYAGLYHSIYGTNVFKLAAMPITDRHKVADIIGKDAEHLAFIFCSCGRPVALIKAARDGPPFFVRHRGTGVRIDLTSQDLLDLLTIEEANLIEQGSLQSVSEVQRARRAMQGWVYAA